MDTYETQTRVLSSMPQKALPPTTAKQAFLGQPFLIKKSQIYIESDVFTKGCQLFGILKEPRKTRYETCFLGLNIFLGRKYTGAGGFGSLITD